MSVTQDKMYRDERFKQVDEDRKYDRESTNDALIEKMIASIQKQSHTLAIPTMVTKMMAKNNAMHLDEIAKNTKDSFSPEQLKQLADINSIHKFSDKMNFEASPYAKYLGEIAGALGALQTVASSKQKAKEQDQIQDNLTKSIYHMQNGGRFRDIGSALGVGTLKSGMNAAATISAGSWLHDMMTTGQISGLTSGTLAASNPGMLLSSLAGGMGGLGNATGWVGAKALGGASMLAGGDTAMGGMLSKGAGALSALDPTSAAILGTLTMVGTSIGAKKLMDNIIKNSPLAAGQRKNRWNLSHTILRATDNPIAMSNYMSANNVVRQMQNQNALSAGETQMITKLNEIAFYTSSLHEIYEVLANKGIHDKNSGTRALNDIENDGTRDMTGLDQRNLFKGGQLSKSMQFFLRHNEGLKYIADMFSISTYYKAAKGENTAPGQFKLREAMQQGDHEGAKKEFASRHNITLSDVGLLHANIKAKIASADTSWEGRMLASSIYTNLFLQMLATQSLKGNGNDNVIGELARLQREQDLAFQKKQSLLIDGTVKPLMEQLAKTKYLSALVPAIQGLTYGARAGTNLISGSSKLLGNLFTKNGRKEIRSNMSGMVEDIRDRVIDTFKPEANKNEGTVRNRLNANRLSLQDQAYMYIARQLPQDMQKIQWLLGSTESAKIQDQYTGEFVTPSELRKRLKDKRKQLLSMTREQDPEESYFEEFKNWAAKKTFKISDRDIQKSTFRNYSHISDLFNELRTSEDPLKQDGDTAFRLNQGGGSATASVNAMQKLNSSIKFLINTMAKNSAQQDYFDMMAKYIPLLQPIKDCVCKEDCDCKDCKDKSSNLSAAFKKKRGLSSNTTQPISNSNPSTSIFKRYGFTSQEAVTNNQEKEKMDKFFDVFFKQMPYIGKLYKIFKPTNAVKSGMLSDKDKESNESESSFFGGLLDWFDGKDKGKNKGPKTSGSGKAMSFLKTGGAAVMDIAKFLFSAKGVGVGILLMALEYSAEYLGERAAYYAKNAFTKLKETMVDAWDKTKGVSEKLGNLMTGNGYNSNSDISKKNQPIQYMGDDQVKTLLSDKGNPQQQLKTLNELKKNAKIDPKKFEQYQKQIVSGFDEDKKNKFGWYLSPDEINKHMQDFNAMDSKTRSEYFGSINNTISNKVSTGTMSENDSKEYKKITDMINKTIVEKSKNEEATQKPELHKELLETLNTLKETNITNSKAITDLSTNQNDVNKQLAESLGIQINSVIGTQQQIGNSIALTTRLNSKPNVYNLDPQIISLIPSLQ